MVFRKSRGLGCSVPSEVRALQKGSKVLNTIDPVGRGVYSIMLLTLVTLPESQPGKR